jgi:AraC-like DNA-binding protein
MCELGIDADAVIERSGIKKAQLYNSQLRTAHAAQELFWKAAEEVSGDTDIGLHLGEHMPLFKGQILEYLFFSSPSFGDGLQRMLNYQRLLSDAAQFQLIDNETEIYLSFNFPDSSLRHLLECTCVVMIKFLQAVSEGTFSPTRIHFIHQGLADSEDYQRILNCPVEFQQSENRIYFKREALNHRSLHTQPELLSLHEQIANQQLANLELQDLIGKVQEQIASLLETGEVNVESVAGLLKMNPRSLRSQLTEAGTSFSQVLNDYRHHLAKRLLAKTQESITEIVYLTGFSEPSTFYRAFKRWEGMTPVEYRKKKQSKDSTAQKA